MSGASPNEEQSRSEEEAFEPGSSDEEEEEEDEEDEEDEDGALGSFLTSFGISKCAVVE